MQIALLLIHRELVEQHAGDHTAGLPRHVRAINSEAVDARVARRTRLVVVVFGRRHIQRVARHVDRAAIRGHQTGAARHTRSGRGIRRVDRHDRQQRLLIVRTRTNDVLRAGQRAEIGRTAVATDAEGVRQRQDRELVAHASDIVVERLIGPIRDDCWIPPSPANRHDSDEVDDV